MYKIVKLNIFFRPEEAMFDKLAKACLPLQIFGSVPEKTKFMWCQTEWEVSICRNPFSLRDEIGTYPNIEVEIDVMAKLPFFIRLYHVNKENKNILDRKMKRLCYLGILKEGFQHIWVQLCWLVGRLQRIREL